MTELEIQAQLEAEQKAKAEAEAQDAAKPEGEQPEGGSDIENKIDYEAELKKEREAREKAEKAAADNAFKLREEKRKREEYNHEDDFTSPEEKPLTATDLQAMLDKQNQTFEKKLNETKVSEIANRIASSKSEADLIVEIYHNRQFPAHLSLDEQMNEAYAIANAKKLVAENNELKRALSNKGGVSRGYASSYQDAMPTSEPKIEADVKAELSAQGFSFNGSTRRYEKKVSNNKVLVYDLKIKKIIAV